MFTVQAMFYGHVTVLTVVSWPLQCCKRRIAFSTSRDV